MTITNRLDAAQPRAHFQQVDSLSSPHARTLSCSFFPVLPNGILTIIRAVRIFNPTTGRDLRSAFDQIIGRRKLAEMNINGGLRAGGVEPVNLWLIMWGSDTPAAEVTVLMCKWSLDQPPSSQCLCWGDGFSMLIQSCLPGMTGDSRTMLPARETIGNQLFSLDFSRALLHAGPSLFALRGHSPSLLKLSALFPSGLPTKRNCYVERRK